MTPDATPKSSATMLACGWSWSSERDWMGRAIIKGDFETSEGEKSRRHFKVRYKSNSRARQKAIDFFRSHGADLLSDVPDGLVELANLSQRDIDKHLLWRKFNQVFSQLTIPSLNNYYHHDCRIDGKDLHRIALLPELRSLTIINMEIADHQLSFTSSLQHLESLILYSPILTDRCAETLSMLSPTLRILDLQGSSGISIETANLIRLRLPWLSRLYPPSQFMKQILSQDCQPPPLPR